MGSPLESKFYAAFEQFGFKPEKQVPIYIDGSNKPLTIADFAVSEKRIAIYIDGAQFHVGQNLRRDRFIRDKLRGLNPPWKVIELRIRDLPDIQKIIVNTIK